MFPALSTPADFERHDPAKLRELAAKLRVSAPSSPILASIEKCLQGQGALKGPAPDGPTR